MFIKFRDLELGKFGIGDFMSKKKPQDPYTTLYKIQNVGNVLMEEFDKYGTDILLLAIDETDYYVFGSMDMNHAAFIISNELKKRED